MPKVKSFEPVVADTKENHKYVDCMMQDLKLVVIFGNLNPSPTFEDALRRLLVASHPYSPSDFRAAAHDLYRSI